MSSGSSVLLVEDNEDNRRMYADYLGMLGFRVLEADNPTDALPMMANAEIIVTDLYLAGQRDAIELIEHVRANESTRLIPIIVVSANHQNAERLPAFKAGCNSFFVKPCLPDTLAAEIQRLLQHSPASVRDSV